MSLTPTEEERVRGLLEQETELLNLSDSEPEIIGKLSSVKVTLSDLASVVALADNDILLVRQSLTDKKITAGVLRSYMQSVTGVSALLVDGSNTMLAPLNFEDLTSQGSAAYTKAESDERFGAGQMLGDAAVKGIFYNAQIIDEDITVMAGVNSGSFGPIAVANGRTVTVEAGSVWSIV
jgi:hypothetical protein